MPEKLNHENVLVEFHRATSNAVLVASIHDGGPAEWIPRSLLSTASDKRTDGYDYLDELELGIIDWKVEELGWTCA